MPEEVKALTQHEVDFQRTKPRVDMFYAERWLATIDALTAERDALKRDNEKLCESIVQLRDMADQYVRERDAAIHQTARECAAEICPGCRGGVVLAPNGVRHVESWLVPTRSTSTLTYTDYCQASALRRKYPLAFAGEGKNHAKR